MSDPHDAGDDDPPSDGDPAPAATSRRSSDADEGESLPEEDPVADESTGGDPAPSADGDPVGSGAAANSPVDDSTATADEPPTDAPAEVGEERTLDERVRYQWLLGPSIGAVVAGVAAGIGGYTMADDVAGVDPTTGAVVGGVAVFGFLVAYAVLRAIYLYRSWRYVVREDSLYLTRGVLTKVQTVVPYVRVQHIDTRRSALERLLGLSRLVVYTAGSRGADVSIPGLTPERADDLQTRLKRLAIESEDEDAV